MDYPTIKILPGEDRRLRTGAPWLYSNELKMDEAAKALPRGSVVRLMAPNGKILGLAHFNPHTLIAARLLTRNKDGKVDRTFLERRIARALALRSKLYAEPWYRLVHAEADGLPGLIVDRFGDVVVLQANTAGMDVLEGEVAAVLDRLLDARVIIARDEAGSRQLEGLPAETRVLKGEAPDRVLVRENGVEFEADPMGGQKTGWFYDQRHNRAFAASLCSGEDVLDLYTYAGGFGLTAAARGAKHVTLVDGSEGALALAAETAAPARPRRALPPREGRRLRLARRPGREKAALRRRHRRPARLRPFEARPPAGPQGLPEARPRCRGAGHRAGLPLPRLLLLSCHDGGVPRGDMGRHPRGRTGRAAADECWRRAGPPDPPEPARECLPQVPGLRPGLGTQPEVVVIALCFY